MKRNIKTEKLLEVLKKDLNNYTQLMKEHAERKEFSIANWYSSRKMYIEMLIDDIERNRL